MSEALTIARATMADVPVLVQLVNHAYRSEASRQGWTTEADLLKGELRTDETTLSLALLEAGTVILKAVTGSGELVGCVYLQKREERLYLGMLAVAPNLQAAGIGKKLMTAAEQHAREQHCTAVFMTVISVRRELLAWYARRGFRDTSVREPMPVDPRFGIPTQPLEFAVLEKLL
jgi:ribosomal protein S18 acetylase RimI-like enzyme